MINIDTAGTLRLHVPDCNNIHIDRTCHGQRSYSGMHLANATTLAETKRVLGSAAATGNGRQASQPVDHL